ncbi:MAG: DNA replication/repair protein RecF [Candidatus Gastranaerophilales bacterium]|nr:DNA replication/repair protein RecF [Candidatus Gastranaerophilales bacterium]MCM1073422.1 DNA replication/repair protein RecF [Bacteroides sp.]
MKINQLSLKNYRNCEELVLDFDKQKTLIIGKNAQGKTNILESIYMLSDLKSPRTSTMTDMIRFNTDCFEINAKLIKNNTDIELDISYNSEKKRELKINKVKTTPKNFKTAVKTVLFSTKDLLLLRGTPQDRRDWLDRAISQIYPAYDERLSKYEKIRIQKNNLLKNEVVDETLLDIYNEQLVITGANIIFLRKKFLKEIEKIASAKHKLISDTEVFTLSYTCPVDEVEEISLYLKYELLERRSEELARRQSCVGPHRDDIELKINGMDAVKFASQGQQRTLVLSLKLGELEIIKEKTGYSPILLLDDVLAELDETRQNYLLKSIEDGTQTIITSVDTLLFEDEFLKDVRIYSIQSGRLI